MWTVVRPAALNSFDMCAPPLRARSRRCSGVKVSCFPMRLNTSRALSATRVQLAVVEEEPAVGRIGGLVGDAGEIERLAVVEGRMAAAVRNRDRMLGRRLVEVLADQRSIELRVVEHEAGDLHFGRGRLDFGADRRLDFADGTKVGIDAVQLFDAARMAVSVDETGLDGHLLRVNDRRPRRRQVADVPG